MRPFSSAWNMPIPDGHNYPPDENADCTPRDSVQESFTRGYRMRGRPLMKPYRTAIRGSPVRLSERIPSDNRDSIGELSDGNRAVTGRYPDFYPSTLIPSYTRYTRYTQAGCMLCMLCMMGVG